MRDVVYEMEVTLEELCRGGSKTVRIWSEGAVDGKGRRERVAKDIDIGPKSDMHTVSGRGLDGRDGGGGRVNRRGGSRTRNERGRECK